MENFDTALAEGVLLLTPFDASASDAKTVAFVKNYTEKFGIAPNQFAADAYDAVYAIYEAMKVAGVDNVTVAPNVLGDALVAVFTSEDFSFSGLTGVMTWDESGASTKVPVIVTLQ